MKRYWTITRRAALVLTIATLTACASSPAPAPADMAQKVEAARTRDDHESLAAYYAQEAGKARATADQHRAMAKAYQGRSDRGSVSMAPHCQSIVASEDAIAAQYDAMAAAHKQMASEVKP